MRREPSQPTPSENQPETQGYSIWLELGRSREDVGKLIRRISRNYGTPEFHPHITLAGQTGSGKKTLVEKTSWLASVTDPFKVKCKQFGFDEGAFFKAFYFEVTPGNPLTDLRKLAEESFSMSDQPFLPHISLMYGYPDAETRNALTTELGNRLPFVADVTGISVVKTDGPVAQWKTVRAFELGN